jgi:hypothetical protein
MLPESCPINWSTPHGVPVLIANASDSIAWSLSKTACMDVIESRRVFIAHWPGQEQDEFELSRSDDTGRFACSSIMPENQLGPYGTVGRVLWGS